MPHTQETPPSHEGCQRPEPTEGGAEIEVIPWNAEASTTERRGCEKTVNLAQQ